VSVHDVDSHLDGVLQMPSTQWATLSEGQDWRADATGAGAASTDRRMSLRGLFLPEGASSK
jgi:hypothetical protein